MRRRDVLAGGGSLAAGASFSAPAITHGFLNLAAGFTALPALSRIAWTQTYPTHPIRLVAPFPPGGSIDLTARLIGEWLTKRLGEQVVIENRPGAGGNIGSESAL